MNSRVESHALAANTQLQYSPEEKIPLLVVDNYPALGRLTAMRFLEWVLENPEGIVALPTGKTPEFFISYTSRYLHSWETKETRRELAAAGIEAAERPELKGLHFVQIDEFYPINPHQTNSFSHYIQTYYLKEFGLDPERAMLIDCEKIGLGPGLTLEDVWDDEGVDLSLRYRRARGTRERLQQDVLQRIDQWCAAYEETIRSLGGIGFFLGGIGPDGHIGFNVRGTDPYSTTRLTEVNYETQAAAASDLGGIEVSRTRKVITIGLQTITFNPHAAAIIIAAGEAKAEIVAAAVCADTGIEYPASALRVLPNSRFYLTRGAAKYLESRNMAEAVNRGSISEVDAARIVIDIAVHHRKKLSELTEEELRHEPWGKVALNLGIDLLEVCRQTEASLKMRIERGAAPERGKVILHTEPHHDDIMLGYLPWAVRNIRVAENTHYFAALTSGFTAVTNRFMLQRLNAMQHALRKGQFEELYREGYFDPADNLCRNRDVWQYLDGVAGMSESQIEEGFLRRFLRDLFEVFEEEDLENISDRVEELINYFQTQYPGKKDLPHIQRLKGMSREWESACLWGYFGWNSSSTGNMRLGFYQGELFTEEPEVERDVLPLVELLRAVAPDVVTVAFDPEGSGPDTHYKVLQALAEALRRYEEESGRSDIRVLGYRNVWYRFHPAETSSCVPVSLNMLTLQHGAVYECLCLPAVRLLSQL